MSEPNSTAVLGEVTNVGAAVATIVGEEVMHKVPIEAVSGDAHEAVAAIPDSAAAVVEASSEIAEVHATDVAPVDGAATIDEVKSSDDVAVDAAVAVDAVMPPAAADVDVAFDAAPSSPLVQGPSEETKSPQSGDKRKAEAEIPQEEAEKVARTE